MTIKKV